MRTVRGELIGVIQVLNKIDGEFTQEDLNTLMAMNTQASVSIQDNIIRLIHR